MLVNRKTLFTASKKEIYCSYPSVKPRSRESVMAFKMMTLQILTFLITGESMYRSGDSQTLLGSRISFKDNHIADLNILAHSHLFSQMLFELLL